MWAIIYVNNSPLSFIQGVSLLSVRLCLHQASTSKQSQCYDDASDGSLVENNRNRKVLRERKWHTARSTGSVVLSGGGTLVFIGGYPSPGYLLAGIQVPPACVVLGTPLPGIGVSPHLGLGYPPPERTWDQRPRKNLGPGYPPPPLGVDRYLWKQYLPLRWPWRSLLTGPYTSGIWTTSRFIPCNSHWRELICFCWNGKWVESNWTIIFVDVKLAAGKWERR